MKRIVLVACASKKGVERARAKDLYQSWLFKMNLAYAKSLKPDFIFILSAKYGLINLDEEIEPYDKTLNKMSLLERKEWAEKVLEDLGKITSFNEDEFIFLAGEKYREFILPQIKNYQVPLQGLGIGRQLKWLKQKLNQ